MIRSLLIVPVFLALLVTSRPDALNEVNLVPVSIQLLPPSCDSIPELNKKILVLVRRQIGKTVDRGECWDLAALVLNQTSAKWNGEYGFGRKIDPEKECVYPGDIIQFEGVKIKYTKGRAEYTETMAHHTAVINEVKAKGVFVLAHQNTGTSGRKVGLSDLDLKTIVKGKYMIYRPVGEIVTSDQ
jgi:hypothetical protein